MNRKSGIIMKKFIIIKWAFELAWKIDKKMLLLWNGLSVLVSVLPAIVLTYQREITDILSKYISTGSVTLDDTIPWIIGYGITMILIGVSARVNKDLIYMMMYDSYYLGMQEYMMESIQEVEIIDLLKSELNDDYNYIVGRAGSLTDIMSGACELIGKFVSIVSLLMVAFSTSKLLFLFSGVYVIAVIILNFGYTEKVRWDTKTFRKISRVASYYESLPYEQGTAKEIRIFESCDLIVKKWKEAYQDVKEYERKRHFQMEMCTFLTTFVFFVFLIVMIFFHLFMMADGILEVSLFVMLFNLCLSLFTAINGIARAILAFDYGLYAIGRQKDFMEKAVFQRKRENKEKIEFDSDIVFRLHDVSFAYQSEKTVLHHLDFEVKRGEVVALVGVNGSGKTTLSKLLLGMYKPTEGKMELCGKPYDQYTSEQIRQKIGVFFQEFFLFHAPIGENVAYGGIDNINNEKQIQEALAKGGAEKLVEKLKYGIQTIIGKSVYTEGVELSGGERQRIAVARAHMSNKDILILDEPASAIDPIAEAEQFLHLKDKLNGRTAILISHRVGFARMADRILMIQDGYLVEVGTHEELIRNNGPYAEFYFKQAEWYETECEDNGR